MRARRCRKGTTASRSSPEIPGQVPFRLRRWGGVSHVAGAFVIRSVDQILPYCVISAEYPECIKVGGMQCKSGQARAAAMAKAKAAGKPF